MLSSLLLVQQAASGDCLPFDPFPFDQNGLASPAERISARGAKSSRQATKSRLAVAFGIDPASVCAPSG